MDELFEGRHFDREIIVLCVRWYLRFSLRDLVEMMAERGLTKAHTTIIRWAQRYAPEFVTLESLRPSHGSIESGPKWGLTSGGVAK